MHLRQCEEKFAWILRRHVGGKFFRPLARPPQESRRESFRISGAPVSGRVVSQMYIAELRFLHPLRILSGFGIYAYDVVLVDEEWNLDNGSIFKRNRFCPGA